MLVISFKISSMSLYTHSGHTEDLTELDELSSVATVSPEEEDEKQLVPLDDSGSLTSEEIGKEFNVVCKVVEEAVCKVSEWDEDWYRTNTLSGRTAILLPTSRCSTIN